MIGDPSSITHYGNTLAQSFPAVAAFAQRLQVAHRIVAAVAQGPDMVNFTPRRNFSSAGAVLA